MITLIHKWYDQYNNDMFYAYDIRKEYLYRLLYDSSYVENLFIKAFANCYKVNNDVAKEIIENFDLWEDEGLLEELLENFMEELDEIFWDDDLCHPDNEYKKDGAC